MGEAAARREVRAERLLAAAGVIALCVAFAVLVEPGRTSHYDHALFLDTIDGQRGGASYYDAHLQAYADRGVAVSEFRSVRQPAIFVLWALLPSDWLWPTYLALVVVGTCAALLWCTDRAVLVLPVAAYLLLAGRIPATTGVEQWLIVELWALPALAGSLAAWRAGRHGLAAWAACIAFLIRETTAPFLLLGLVLGWSAPGGRRPWLAATTIAVVGYGLHVAVVLPKLSTVGSEARVAGTGRPPDTIFDMVGWMLPGPPVLALSALGLACYRVLRHRHDLLPVGGLLAIAATGAIVARPYWGFLFIPFVLLLAAEQVTDVIAVARSGNDAHDADHRSRPATNPGI